MQKLKTFVLVLAGCVPLVAQTTSKFAGIWEGKMNGQPGVEVTIEAPAGKIAGKIVFYFQERRVDGSWQTKDKYEAPLLAVTEQGKSLSFEVAHHKTHDSPEFVPKVKFRMDLTDTGAAILHREGQD